MPTHLQRAVANDLLEALSDDTLNDIHITSQLDGENERIPAIRFVLAARSPVFRKMLYGSFREANADTVALSYSCSTLEAVVHFCSFNDFSASLRCDDIHDHNAISVNQLVQIVKAADFLELPELKRRTELVIKSIMSNTPSLACVVLEETESSSSLATAALVVIESRPYVALGEGITHLSQSKVEMIFKNPTLGAGEWFLYRLLAQWHERDEDVDATRSLCSRCIRLTNIDPSLLLTMRDCPWVSNDAIFEAVAKQAVRASQRKVWCLDFRGSAEKTDRVLVEGAGSKECNGMYYRIAPGLSNGSDLYSKREVACGQQYVYTLSRRLLSRTPEADAETKEIIGQEAYYECRIFRNSFLSYNAVKQLEAMQISSGIVPSFQPVLQILELDPPSLDAVEASVPTPIREFHRVRVSDGCTHMYGTLSPELSSWIEKGELDVNHVIQVHEFGMYRIHGCAGIHVIRGKVVTTAPMFRFGDPKPLPPLEEEKLSPVEGTSKPRPDHQNLYTCEYPASSEERIPQSMWLADEGLNPVPECWFVHSLKEGGSSSGST